MSYFPKTLSRGQELSCELVKEIERRYNTHASLEAALLQVQNAAIDLAKQLVSSNEQHARDVATLDAWNSAITDLQQQLAASQALEEAYRAEWGRNQKAVIVPKGELK
jgi:hypothetical protein